MACYWFNRRLDIYVGCYEATPMHVNEIASVQILLMQVLSVNGKRPIYIQYLRSCVCILC